MSVANSHRSTTKHNRAEPTHAKIPQSGCPRDNYIAVLAAPLVRRRIGGLLELSTDQGQKTRADVTTREGGLRPMSQIPSGMPDITSRRSLNAPAECWQIYYGYVHR